MNKDYEMDKLINICEERGIKILQNSSIKDGSITYKNKLNAILVGDFVDEVNTACFQECFDQKYQKACQAV